MITPDPNVSLRPTWKPIKSVLWTDINPDFAGGSTCHLNTAAGLEHVNRTASPGMPHWCWTLMRPLLKWNSFNHTRNTIYLVLHSYLLSESQSSLLTEDAWSLTSSPLFNRANLIKCKSKMWHLYLYCLDYLQSWTVGLLSVWVQKKVKLRSNILTHTLYPKPYMCYICRVVLKKFSKSKDR